MFKQWFDKRADDGNDWTIREQVNKDYNPMSWEMTISIRFIADRVIKSRDRDVIKYGKMTKEEAIAMAKLLTATGVQHDSE
jgi:hypothetical protein